MARSTWLRGPGRSAAGPRARPRTQSRAARRRRAAQRSAGRPSPGAPVEARGPDDRDAGSVGWPMGSRGGLVPYDTRAMTDSPPPDRGASGAPDAPADRLATPYRTHT